MDSTQWRPHWWTQSTHGTTWDQVKEALKRDWEQTKKDLHLGGHELHQTAKDTLQQASGKEPLTSTTNPQTSSAAATPAAWNDVEGPMGYGYAARQHYGSEHTGWSSDLESKLKSEWVSAEEKTKRTWDEVKGHVRHGYEYNRK